MNPSVPKPSTITASIVAAGLALTALVGCSSATSSSPAATATSSEAATGSSFPVTLTAANGPVTISARPARIVSLSATGTEDLYAIGAGPQVVAVDSYSDYPPGAPVTKLSGLTPNVEAIAKYNPGLVVAAQDTGGLVSGLSKLNIPVLIEPAATSLAGAYAQIDQLGRATGHQAQSDQTVTSMKTQIAATVSQAGASHPDLTYYWELSANPYYSAASSTFIGQIVALFGLKNVADAADKASDGGYPELSEEYIVKSQPKIIFLADNQASDGGQSVAVVSRRAGWSVIPAVKDHEVVGLNDDIASRWGPRLPQLVTEIAQAVEQALK